MRDIKKMRGENGVRGLGATGAADFHTWKYIL